MTFRHPFSVISADQGEQPALSEVEREKSLGIISVTMGLRPAAARIADAVNSPQCHPGWSDLPRTAIRGADVRGPESPGTPALSDVEGASPRGSGPRIGVRGGNVGVLRTSTNERPLQFPPASSRRRREIRHGIVKHINPKSFQRGASDRGVAREGYRRSAAHRSAPARSGRYGGLGMGRQTARMQKTLWIDRSFYLVQGEKWRKSAVCAD